MTGQEGGKRPRDPYTEFQDNLKDIADGVRLAARAFRRDFKHAAQKAEREAAHALLEGERLYKEWDVSKRIAGASLGAKAGFWTGFAAGPKGIAICMTAGIAIGAVKGPDGINACKTTYRNWLGKFRSNDNEPGKDAPDHSLKNGPV